MVEERMAMRKFGEAFVALANHVEDKGLVGGCYILTAVLHTIAKTIGIKSVPLIGEVGQKKGKKIKNAWDHAWLEIGGEVYDIAIAYPLIAAYQSGPYYRSRNVCNGKDADAEIAYGINTGLGLGEIAWEVASGTVFEYMDKCPKEIGAFEMAIDSLKEAGVKATKKSIKKTLGDDKFSVK